MPGDDGERHRTLYAERGTHAKAGDGIRAEVDFGAWSDLSDAEARRAARRSESESREAILCCGNQRRLGFFLPRPISVGATEIFITTRVDRRRGVAVVAPCVVCVRAEDGRRNRNECPRNNPFASFPLLPNLVSPPASSPTNLTSRHGRECRARSTRKQPNRISHEMRG